MQKRYLIVNAFSKIDDRIDNQPSGVNAQIIDLKNDKACFTYSLLELYI